jgi:integrase
MSVHKLNNGNWCFRKRITLSDGTVKNIQRTYKTKKEAQLQEQLFKISNNEIAKVTFNDVYLHYVEYKKSRTKLSTTYNMQKLVEKHIIPVFGSKEIDKITTKDIINWQNTLNDEEYSQNYKSKTFTYFKAVMQHGVKHFDLKTNVAMLVDNFRRSKVDRKVDFWTYKEFEKFISVVDDPVYNLFFTVLYFTGLRKGEAQALKWNDFYWDKKEIRIDQTLAVSNGSGSSYTSPPKNMNACRDVLLADDVYNRLKGHYECEKLIDGFNDDCYVFGTTQFLSHSAITRHKDKYCEIANVKQIKVHDIRHSFASMMINLGVDIYVLSKLMGHASIEETTGTYGHLYPSKQTKIIDKLNNKEYLKLDKIEETEENKINTKVG